MIYLSKAYVYVVFYGDNFSPNEFSSCINLPPTNVGIKGERGNYGAILKDTFWEYKMKETNAIEGLENSINEIRKIFETRQEIIHGYVLEKKIKSKCYIVIKSQNNEDNGVVLDDYFISFLNKFKMQIEINVYTES